MAIANPPAPLSLRIGQTNRALPGQKVSGDGLLVLEEPDFTLLAVIVVTSGLAVPLASPDQPRNSCPASGTASSVILAPFPKRLASGVLVT